MDIVDGDFQLMTVEKVAYFGINLTPEQAEIVRGKRMSLYSINGETLFATKNEEGKVVGYVFFVVWDRG